jgi:hypothetical protein
MLLHLHELIPWLLTFAKRCLGSKPAGRAALVVLAVVCESPRDCRRLHLLRGWGHDTQNEVFPRSARAGGSNGPRSRERLRLPGVVSGDVLDLFEVGFGEAA